MVLRKITIDNSVRFIPKSEQTRDKLIKPNTIKNKLLPRKQGRGIPRSKKISLRNIAAGGFGILK